MRSSVLITTNSCTSIKTPMSSKRSTVKQPFSKLTKNLSHSNHSRTKMDSLAGSSLSSIRLAATSIRSLILIMGHRSASYKSLPSAERTTCTGCRRSRSIRNLRWSLRISRIWWDCLRLRLSKSWNSSSSKVCRTSWEASSTNKRRSFHRV